MTMVKSDSSSPTVGSTATDASAATGTFAPARALPSASSTVTAVAIGNVQSVTASRTEGSISVRLVPVESRDGKVDTAT
jgi:hypothetical protein